MSPGSGDSGSGPTNNLSPAELAQIQANGVWDNNVLSLLPGRYEVRVVVSDNLKGSMVSIVTTLRVQ